MRSGRTEHPCDARFGRDVGRVIAEARRQIEQRQIEQRQIEQRQIEQRKAGDVG